MSLLLALAMTAVSALMVDDNGAPLAGVFVAGLDGDGCASTGPPVLTHGVSQGGVSNRHQETRRGHRDGDAIGGGAGSSAVPMADE